MLFYCTFRALRAEDTVNPVSGNQDAELRHEEVVFAGYVYLVIEATWLLNLLL